jgi:hypothetical protein
MSRISAQKAARELDAKKRQALFFSHCNVCAFIGKLGRDKFTPSM